MPKKKNRNEKSAGARDITIRLDRKTFRIVEMARRASGRRSNKSYVVRVLKDALERDSGAQFVRDLDLLVRHGRADDR